VIKSGGSCKTIILCGGKGTRLGNLGEIVPKTLVDFHGKPILYHKLDRSIQQGFDEFIIATGYKSEMVVDACKKMDLKCNVEFSDSDEKDGMLKRIYQARALFEDKVIVTYGDTFTHLEIADLIRFHQSNESLLSIVIAPIQSPFALVATNHECKVFSLEEKPLLYYYIGTFIMEKRAFDFIPEQIINWPDGKGLIAFFKMLIAIEKLSSYIYDGPEITFNTIEELDAAKEGFLKFYTHFQ
jgi:NDP-sugar pyrophosphorylase family protein